MPSPFPGMDPFVEMQEWDDFHTTFNTVLREQLAPDVEPRYVVRVERRVYVEGSFQDADQWRSADAAIIWAGNQPLSTTNASADRATAVAPVECEIPMPQERRETYLVIRERETMEVVTVIETLSPTNKRTSSDGRAQYLEKRQETLQSRSNLVEIDLLRGGARLPMIGSPVGDYFAIVSRSRRRPKASSYAWTLRQQMPTIAIPLKGEDPDVALDLQKVFTTTYERARYQLSLDYTGELVPPLSGEDLAWMRSLLVESR
jgi:hypothetical protein